MPDYLISAIGLSAAALTSLSYIPQLQKALPRGSTHDLSWKTLVALTLGLLLWIIYGSLKGDWVLVLSNVIATSLSAAVLICKARDMIGKPNKSAS